jgi:uncharacterized protein (TIRG00374 family)
MNGFVKTQFRNVVQMSNDDIDEKPKSKRRYMLYIAGVCVLILIIYWANPQEVYINLKNADPQFILFAFLMNLTTTFLMISRWIILYRQEAPHVSFLNSARIYMVGQATNQVLPMGSGEIARGLIGSRYFNVHFSKTLVAAVIERMADILFFLILAILCFSLILPGQRFYLYMTAFLVFTILGFIFVMRPQTMDRLFFKLEKAFEYRGRFWAKLSTKLISSWERFKNSMYAYHKRKGILFITGTLTVVIWSLDAVTQLLVLKAFNVDIYYPHMLGIVGASFIIGALSFLPGGIGAREGSFASLLSIIGITKDTGVPAAMIYKSIVYIIVGIGAGLSLKTLPPMLKKKDQKHRL